MLSKLKKTQQQKSDQGFTIIEVMIVLAIAGLILLIVFLAVPALQRTSRNTQRKNDAAAIASTIATYVSNANGALPNATGIDATTAGSVDFCDTAACAAAKIKETAKLGYYGTGQEFIGTTPAAGATFVSTATVATAYGLNVDKDSVMVALKGSCDDTTQGKVNFSSRNAAIIYVTEQSGSGTGNIQCVEQ